MVGGTQLREVDFYDRNIGPEQITTVISEVQSQTTGGDPLVIDLSQNPLTDEGFIALKDIFINPQVLEIRLDNTQLTSAIIPPLCEYLSQRPVPLQALSLGGNLLGDSSASRLATFLQHYQILSLDLANCGLTSTGITCFLKAFARHDFLEKLRLDQNKATEATEEIADFMILNTKLTSLSLSYTQLDQNPHFLEILSFGLSKNITLQELNLSGHQAPNYTDNFYLYITQNLSLIDYVGPDVISSQCPSKGIIAHVCERNIWLREIPEKETKRHQLYLQTPPVTSSSLLFVATHSAVRTSQLAADGAIMTSAGTAPECHYLGTSILENVFSEACNASIQARIKRESIRQQTKNKPRGGKC